MTLHELSILKDVTAVHIPDAGATVAAGYTSDLLSDVVANCPSDAVLITLQAHANTVAVCTLVGAVAILVCGDRQIPDTMRTAVQKEQIALLTTPMNQFDASFAVKTALRSA